MAVFNLVVLRQNRAVSWESYSRSVSRRRKHWELDLCGKLM